MPNLSQIEQAIKDKIASLNRPYINEIKTYGGEFDDDLGLDQVARKFPAIWTTFSGTPNPPKPLGAKKWHVDLTFTVIVGARSIRNEESAREGVLVNGVLQVGSFQLLWDVCYALAGQNLGLKMNELQPGKIATIFNTKTKAETVSVLAMDWHTYIQISRTDFEALGADWLEKVSMNYLLRPGADQAEGPAVSDLVTLPESS